jgi:hypothetical protein
MPNCPDCQTPGAYVGFSTVECRNPDCKNFRLPEEPTCGCCGKPESDCRMGRISKLYAQRDEPVETTSTPQRMDGESFASFLYRLHYGKVALIEDIDQATPEYIELVCDLNGPDSVLNIKPHYGFEEIKNNLMWGTYGRPARLPMRLVKLCECSDEHLRNILIHRGGDDINDMYQKVIRSILKDRDEGRRPHVSDPVIAQGEYDVMRLRAAGIDARMPGIG